ncbi:MAG: cytochrome c biogenesis protein CcsA [Roseiflexaceae bacterium]|jgi:cytochrome c-type biogenesis protein CcmF
MSVYFFGTLLIVATIAMAAMASISYLLVPTGRQFALNYGRIGTRLTLVGVVAVVVLLNYLFVAQRYDVEYVYNYSSQELEPYFRVAAVWAGQPGSFVIWVLWGVIGAQFLIRRTRHAEPYVLGIVMAIQFGLLVCMLVRNPFILHVTPDGIPPTDGKGLNPTLHNMWMLIHPPILFIGFALMAIPFGYAIAGLWRRDYDGWVLAALPWTIASWAVLGLALLLGGYWAYETLGWGGYWGWDPVENSALVPWLTVAALIHAMLVQRAGGAMRRTTLVLAVVTYVLVFYSTFLTRSGVLSSFSVHSFVEEGLKWLMTGFLASLILIGGGFIAWRWRDIPSKALSDKLLSRDSFFALMILVVMLMAGVVALGTSMPVISAIPGVGSSLQSFFGSMFQLDDGTTYDMNAQPFEDGRFGLVGSFYSTTVAPLGLIMTVLMIIGPLLGWRDSNPRHLLRAIRWPGVAAVAVTCVAIVLGTRSLYSVAYVGLATFAIGTNVLMIIRTLKGGWLRIGGYMAHVGLMVFIVGAVASTWYATPETRVVIPEGEKMAIYGYDLTFNGWRMDANGRGVLDMTVNRGGNESPATPQLYFNSRMGATMATPSVRSEIFQDLYISPVEYTPAFDRNIADLEEGQSKKVGPYTITFNGFVVPTDHSSNADISARLSVNYEGQTTEIVPGIVILADEPDPAKAIKELPVALPGGHNASLAAFDPTQKRVIINVSGLNLPVEPARAVVTVTVKPGVVLVWSGIIIGVLGGLLAVLRRAIEAGMTLGTVWNSASLWARGLGRDDALSRVK